MLDTDDLQDDDRVTGYATKWWNKFGKVIDEIGQTWNVDHRDLAEDFCGRRYLLANEIVRFSPALDHKNRRTAKNVRVVSRPLHEVLPADYREIVDVASIFPKGGYGFATRHLITPEGFSIECGQLFLHVRDFAVREDFDSVEVGTKLNVAIARPDRLNIGWRATDIFVVQPEVASVVAAATHEESHKSAVPSEKKQNIGASKHRTREQQKAAGEKEVYADADATARIGLAGKLSAALKGDG